MEGFIDRLLGDRAKGPLMMNIIGSWIIWNWQIIYILLASDTHSGFKDRLDYISTNYWNPTDLFAIPFLLGLTISLLLPWVNVAVGEWRLWVLRNKARRETLHDQKLENLVEKETLGSVEEIFNLLISGSTQITVSDEHYARNMKFRLEQIASKLDNRNLPKNLKEKFTQLKRKIVVDTDHILSGAKRASKYRAKAWVNLNADNIISDLPKNYDIAQMNPDAFGFGFDYADGKPFIPYFLMNTTGPNDESIQTYKITLTKNDFGNIQDIVDKHFKVFTLEVISADQARMTETVKTVSLVDFARNQRR